MRKEQLQSMAGISRFRLMGVMALVAMLGFPALAKKPITPKPVRAAEINKLRLLSSAGKDLGECPLKHTDVNADISGFVARVNVRQEFQNTAKVPVEAIYTFPLPADAAVDDMTMLIGKRRIVGKIKLREEATRIYQAAKTAGKTASLLHQERPNIFTQNIANIMPGQKIVISISYVNMLKYDEGSYQFVFPTVVGPRYIAGGGGQQVPGKRGIEGDSNHNEGAPGAPAVITDAEKITPPIVPQGARTGHNISLSLNLDVGVPLYEVNSELHPITVTRRGATAATVRLREGSTLPNRDFVLRFRVGDKNIEAGVLAYAPREGNGYFTLVLQPPVAPPQEAVAPKELIFVIDQTGSQDGWPLKKAKETMRYCIEKLNPDDTFQLMGFNTEVYPCFEKPVAATPQNVKKALTFLSGIEAEGATDILKSVDYALKLPDDPARLRIICYMTDGYVGNDMQVIDHIRKNRGRARMFPFGIGNSVNRFLIDAMASEGRGAAEYVSLGMTKAEMEAMWHRQDAGEADTTAAAIEKTPQARNFASRFYKRISQPVLLNPTVDWGDLPVTDVYPGQIPDLFSAGPIILKGRFTRAAEGDITLSGVLRGKSWSQKIHVVLPSSGQQTLGTAIPSLWARARIADLQMQDWLGAQSGQPDATVTKQITEVALAHRLMSQYTSFVAVEEKIVSEGGEQKIVDVPVEMPAGVSYKGIFGNNAGNAKGQKASSYRVASGQQFAGRAGDPLITVDAAEDALQVIAVLASGEIKRLIFNPQNRKWEARFDIPTYSPEGTYHVSVIVVTKDGTRRQLVLRYLVDTTSPQGTARARLSKTTSPVVRLELEAGPDTDRVETLLPWGERVELKRSDTQPNLFAASVDVPKAYRGKASQATFILTDHAHNRTTVTVDMSQ